MKCIPPRTCAWAILLLPMIIGTVGCAMPNSGVKSIVLEGVRPTSERLAEARLLSKQAQHATSAGDLETAELLYVQALGVYDDFAPAWNNLGLIYLEQERYMDAAEVFASAITKAPMDPRPAYNLGLTWERAGYMSDALKHYSSSLERDPRYLPALRGAIRGQQLLGKLDEITSERLRVALLVEWDPDWRAYFEEQKTRVDDQARDLIGIRSGNGT